MNSLLDGIEPGDLVSVKWKISFGFTPESIGYVSFKKMQLSYDYYNTVVILNVFSTDSTIHLNENYIESIRKLTPEEEIQFRLES